jgi:hypothetical protein
VSATAPSATAEAVGDSGAAPANPRGAKGKQASRERPSADQGAADDKAAVRDMAAAAALAAAAAEACEADGEGQETIGQLQARLRFVREEWQELKGELNASNEREAMRKAKMQATP